VVFLCRVFHRAFPVRFSLPCISCVLCHALSFCRAFSWLCTAKVYLSCGRLTAKYHFTAMTVFPVAMHASSVPCVNTKHEPCFTLHALHAMI
jgi:hypothetical protein